ncbi:MAG: hypothetical protein WA874_19055 [Chryseosolibacter sp.]
MDSSYTPVQYVYKEVIAEEIEKGTIGKIFYFSEGSMVEEVQGSIARLEEVEKKGEFITMDPEAQVRIDRIITLFGKPGAAFDEYDAYANACLDCKGGYDLD